MKNDRMDGLPADRDAAARRGMWSRTVRPRGIGAALGLALAGLALAGCAHQEGGLASGGAFTSAGSLVGATPKTLEASLGRPWLRRNDGGAEVWLYRSGTCRLDVFLYRARGAAVGGDPRVSSATPMPHGIPARSCLASLERRTTS